MSLLPVTNDGRTIDGSFVEEMLNAVTDPEERSLLLGLFEQAQDAQNMAIYGWCSDRASSRSWSYSSDTSSPRSTVSSSTTTPSPQTSAASSHSPTMPPISLPPAYTSPQTLSPSSVPSPLSDNSRGSFSPGLLPLAESFYKTSDRFKLSLPSTLPPGAESPYNGCIVSFPPQQSAEQKERFLQSIVSSCPSSPQTASTQTTPSPSPSNEASLPEGPPQKKRKTTSHGFFLTEKKNKQEISTEDVVPEPPSLKDNGKSLPILDKTVQLACESTALPPALPKLQQRSVVRSKRKRPSNTQVEKKRTVSGAEKEEKKPSIPIEEIMRTLRSNDKSPSSIAKDDPVLDRKLPNIVLTPASMQYFEEYMELAEQILYGEGFSIGIKKRFLLEALRILHCISKGKCSGSSDEAILEGIQKIDTLHTLLAYIWVNSVFRDPDVEG